jgi:hypothetical protein
LQDYLDLWARFDSIVDELTKRGKKDEADYLMIKFFIFFREFDRLGEFAVNAEEMLATDEW